MTLCTEKTYLGMVDTQTRLVAKAKQEVSALNELAGRVNSYPKVGEPPLLDVMFEDWLIPGLKTSKTGARLAQELLTKGERAIVSLTSEFQNSKKLIKHFEKHGFEFDAHNAADYLSLGKVIIEDGIKVGYSYLNETRTGYLMFMGNSSKGDAKFSFVGTDCYVAITIIHTESKASFWEMLNDNKFGKTIRVKP